VHLAIYHVHAWPFGRWIKRVAGWRLLQFRSTLADGQRIDRLIPHLMMDRQFETLREKCLEHVGNLVCGESPPLFDGLFLFWNSGIEGPGPLIPLGLKERRPCEIIENRVMCHRELL